MSWKKMPAGNERRQLCVWQLEQAELRVDVFLGRCLGLNRSQLKKRLDQLQCNGRVAKLCRHIQPGDLLEFLLHPEEESHLEAEPLPLDIIYQDHQLLVVNKAQGVVVHPGDGNRHATLIQGLLHYDSQQRNLDINPLRMGLIHRLDKDTSGVLLVARSLESLNYFSEQFAQRCVEKIYLAVVRGQLPAHKGSIDTHLKRDPQNRKRFKAVPNGGRTALTHYWVLAQRGNYALVKLRPLTGRTHQLRCHLLHLRAPIVGDPIYSRRDPILPEATLLLHALTLRITLPDGRKRSFYAPLPEHFKKAVRQLAALP